MQQSWMRADCCSSCCRNEAAQGSVGGRQWACSCRRAWVSYRFWWDVKCIDAFLVVLFGVAREIIIDHPRTTRTVALLVIISSQTL
jgi:hypothetical protein